MSSPRRLLQRSATTHVLATPMRIDPPARPTDSPSTVGVRRPTVTTGPHLVTLAHHRGTLTKGATVPELEVLLLHRTWSWSGICSKRTLTDSGASRPLPSCASAAHRPSASLGEGAREWPPSRERATCVTHGVAVSFTRAPRAIGHCVSSLDRRAVYLLSRLSLGSPAAVPPALGGHAGAPPLDLVLAERSAALVVPLPGGRLRRAIPSNMRRRMK